MGVLPTPKMSLSLFRVSTLRLCLAEMPNTLIVNSKAGVGYLVTRKRSKFLMKPGTN